MFSSLSIDKHMNSPILKEQRSGLLTCSGFALVEEQRFGLLTCSGLALVEEQWLKLNMLGFCFGRRAVVEIEHARFNFNINFNFNFNF